MKDKRRISRYDAIVRPFRRWGAWLRGIRVSHDSSPLAPYATDIDFGVAVTNKAAFKLSAFFAGIRLISENIASLPKSVKKEDARGSTVLVKAHTINKLLHKPNKYTNGMTFWMVIITWLKGWGNSYAVIKRDRTGRPAELHQVHPNCMEVSFVSGEKRYKVTMADPDFQFLDGIYSDDDILHFMELSYDGIIGVNTIIENALAIGK